MFGRVLEYILRIAGAVITKYVRVLEYILRIAGAVITKYVCTFLTLSRLGMYLLGIFLLDSYLSSFPHTKMPSSRNWVRKKI